MDSLIKFLIILNVVPVLALLLFTLIRDIVLCAGRLTGLLPPLAHAEWGGPGQRLVPTFFKMPPAGSSALWRGPAPGPSPSSAPPHVVINMGHLPASLDMADLPGSMSSGSGHHAAGFFRRQCPLPLTASLASSPGLNAWPHTSLSLVFRAFRLGATRLS